MKITQKKYLKAKAIVEAYEQQFHKTAVMRSFTEKDLTILSNCIQVESLTDEIVDEGYAYVLQEKIERFLGDSVRWVSLDDMGFISITFGNTRTIFITKKHIDAVLLALNDA